jgi:hypothetical protein
MVVIANKFETCVTLGNLGFFRGKYIVPGVRCLSPPKELGPFPMENSLFLEEVFFFFS